MTKKQTKRPASSPTDTRTLLAKKLGFDVEDIESKIAKAKMARERRVQAESYPEPPKRNVISNRPNCFKRRTPTITSSEPMCWVSRLNPADRVPDLRSSPNVSNPTTRQEEPHNDLVMKQFFEAC